MRRPFLLGGLTVLIGALGTAFPAGTALIVRQESSPPCVQYTQPGPDGAGVPPPQSLASYVNGGNIKTIVLGEVQSVEEGPVVGNSSNRLIVGTLSVTNTLKSPRPIQSVAAGSFNFGGNFAMKPHQRYLLFLYDENPSGLQMVPERSGVPRLRISASFCVDSADKVHSSTKGRIGVASTQLDGILGPMDGLTLEGVLTEIRLALRGGNN